MLQTQTGRDNQIKTQTKTHLQLPVSSAGNPVTTPTAAQTRQINKANNVQCLFHQETKPQTHKDLLKITITFLISLVTGATKKAILHPTVRIWTKRENLKIPPNGPRVLIRQILGVVMIATVGVKLPKEHTSVIKAILAHRQVIGQENQKFAGNVA